MGLKLPDSPGPANAREGLKFPEYERVSGLQVFRLHKPQLFRGGLDRLQGGRKGVGF